jgi:hypothetical protein
MLDELAKIGEISLSGLAPRTVVERGQPAPPMPNAGLEKAMNLLDRLDLEQAQGMPKMASRKKRTANATQVALPGSNALAGRSSEEKKNTYDSAKSGVLHGLAGLTGGGAVGDFVAGGGAKFNTARKMRWRGSAIGAGVGLTEFARKQLKARKDAKAKTAAAFTSPGVQLKNSRQVGAQPNRTTLGGPSPMAVTRKAFGGKTP